LGIWGEVSFFDQVATLMAHEVSHVDSTEHGTCQLFVMPYRADGQLLETEHAVSDGQDQAQRPQIACLVNVVVIFYVKVSRGWTILVVVGFWHLCSKDDMNGKHIDSVPEGQPDGGSS
jgi:hypothetical protein